MLPQRVDGMTSIGLVGQLQDDPRTRETMTETGTRSWACDWDENRLLTQRLNQALAAVRTIETDTSCWADDWNEYPLLNRWLDGRPVWRAKAIRKVPT